jgi:hypothetical protein
LEDLGLYGGIILKLMFKKWDGKAWIRLSWLRIGTGGGLIECGSEPSVYTKCGEFID